MNAASDTNYSDEIICSCSGTTKAKILSLIARGLNDIDEIASMTGANTGCGGCEYLILELLEQNS